MPTCILVVVYVSVCVFHSPSNVKISFFYLFDFESVFFYSCNPLFSVISNLSQNNVRYIKLQTRLKFLVSFLIFHSLLLRCSVHNYAFVFVTENSLWQKQHHFRPSTSKFKAAAAVKKASISRTPFFCFRRCAHDFAFFPSSLLFFIVSFIFF